jgi:hypothetical protein
MNTGTWIPVLLALAFGCMLCTGCISPASPPVAPVTSPVAPPATVTAPSPAIFPTAPAVPVTPAATTDTATASGTLQVPATTPVPEYFTAANEPDNPWLQNLVFTKSYFPFTVPDCAMKELFPDVAQDPGYGIRQPVPKLVVLSPDRLSTFIQEYTYGNPSPSASAGCAAAPANQGWNFVRIQGTILPRNARPADYDSLLEVRSQGRIIAQSASNETLVLDQPFSYERYVPLKTDEMDLFDGIELLFHRNT